MAVPYLSRMETRPNTPTVLQAGVWEAKRPSVLADIAVVTPGGEAAFNELAKSVPSIWGYAQLFYEAWEDDRHPLHARMVEIWRRFLGLIALRDLLPAEVGVSLVPIGLDSGSRGFAGAAWNQLPWTLFGPPTRTATMLGILGPDCVLGLGIPGLLVLPSRAVLEPTLGPSGVPERVAKYLGLDQGTDGSRRYIGLWGARRTSALGAWLATVLVPLRAGAREGNPLLGTLVNRLDLFHEVLRAELQQSPSSPTVRWKIPDDRAPGMPLGCLYASPEADPLASPADCRLVPREGFVTDGRYLVLVADALARNPDLCELRLTDGSSVQDLAETEVPNRRAMFFYNHSSVLVRPADLFADTLVRFADERPFRPHPAGLARYLLPLKALTLCLVEADQIAERLHIEDGGDRVRVFLELELGHSSSGTTVTLARDYTRNDNTLVEAAVPATFAMWPDICVGEGPGHDLVYQSAEMAGRTDANSGGTLAPVLAKLALTRAALGAALRQLCGEQPVPSRPPELERLLASAASPEIRLVGAASALLLVRSLLTATEPIEALACKAGGAAGLLLVNRRQPARALNAGMPCRAALDFGTTNTAIALRVGDSGPVRTQLETHVWMPFEQDAIDRAQGDPQALRSIASVSPVTADFIPVVGPITSPFLSVLEIREDVRSPAPLAEARIPFVREMGVRDAIVRILGGAGLRHEFGLKWDAQGDKREYVKRFLRQVAMQVAAEARSKGVLPANIEWRVTLPRSLDATLKRRFDGEVREALADVVRAVGPDAVRVSFLHESEAVYAYLMEHQPEGANDLVAIFDVGGRSTDIALLRLDPDQPVPASRPLWDGSARFAGQLVLVDDWAKRPEELAALLLEIPEVPIERMQIEASRGHPERLRPLVEIILNDEAFAQRLWSAADRGDVAAGLLERSRLRARLSLLGMVWLLVSFALAPLAKRGGLTGAQGVSLFFAGRGSRIFRELCRERSGRRFVDQALIDDWLAAEGLGSRPCTVEFSRDPKLEVAIGAVYSDFSSDHVPLGTAALVAPVGGLAEAAPDAGGDGWSAWNEGLAMLRAFCTACAPHFPELPGLTKAFSEGGSTLVYSTLHGRQVNLDRIGFEASDDAGAPGRNPRRTFVLGLTSLLECFDELLPPAN